MGCGADRRSAGRTAICSDARLWGRRLALRLAACADPRCRRCRYRVAAVTLRPGFAEQQRFCAARIGDGCAAASVRRSRLDLHDDLSCEWRAAHVAAALRFARPYGLANAHPIDRVT